MKKVFIVHGLNGSPNGGWRPWLMGELEKQGVYACALSMPSPEKPVRDEWVEEIARHVERNGNDEIYLVGHSLGVPAILRFLESVARPGQVSGAVLVSGPCEMIAKKETDNFLDSPFDFKTIASKTKKFAVIHGDNDDRVPLRHAEILSNSLPAELIIVPNGGHLNGASGWNALPQCLDALMKMTGNTAA